MPKKQKEKKENNEESSQEIKKTAHSRANYGSGENRRVCHKCGSDRSKVNHTTTINRLVVRYRTCNECGTKRATQEIIPQRGVDTSNLIAS